MDKRRIIAVASSKNDYAKWEVEKITDSLLSAMFESIRHGEEIHLKGFGKFKLKVSPERTVLHPKSGKPMVIPEKVSVVFTVSRKFKADVGVIEKLKRKSE